MFSVASVAVMQRSPTNLSVLGVAFRSDPLALPCGLGRPRAEEAAMPGPKAKPIIDRFWAAVEIKDGCWGWKLSIAGAGYGIIQVQKRKENIRYNIYAHRYSWEIHKGAIPNGLYVLHSCDNPICANPGHLFLGTQADNLKDCVSKGRDNAKSKSRPGELNHEAKLTEKEVILIRSDSRDPKILGKLFKVTSTTIQDIKARRSWKHVL